MLISIIIPTFNEKSNIPIIVNSIDSTLDKNYEIIIVDKYSKDGTGKIAEKLSKKYPIRVFYDYGDLSNAVIKGFSYARGDMIAVMDADLQHPPEKLPILLKEIENADIVIGTRCMSSLTFKRKIISKGAKLLVMILFPSIRKLKEPHSGFFMLKKKVIEGIKLEPIGFKILLEILLKGNYKDVVEVPFIFEKRREGKSKLNVREILNFLRHVLSLKLGL